MTFPIGRLFTTTFFTWKKALIIEHIHQELVENTRKTEGKNEEPTIGIIDAQSVNNTLVSGESRGFDAGKKIKGIKRHIIVDSLGLILAVVIQSASTQDRNGAVEVMEKLVEYWKKSLRFLQIVATVEG